MDPVLGALFIAGVLWSLKQGGAGFARSARSARAGARERATARGGTHNADAAKRRAARQATAGYWGSELRHGFPSFRHGVARGWDQHQEALAGWRREQLDRQHRKAERDASWRETLLDHSRRMGEARDRGYEPDPPEGEERTYDDPPAGPLRRPRERDGQPGEPGGTSDPPDGGKGSSNGQPGKEPGDSQTGDTQMTSPNGSGGDFNYPEAVDTAEKLIEAADQAVNEEVIAKATGLADGLGAMIPDDATTLGMAADAAQAVQDIKEANQRAQDAAAALKSRLEGTYGHTHESVQASGERAAQPEFHDA